MSGMHTTEIRGEETSDRDASKTCKTCNIAPAAAAGTNRPDRPPPRPVIYVSPGEIPSIVATAEVELARSRLCFQRGGVLVTVAADPATSETSVKILLLSALIRFLADIVVWQKYDKRSGGWEICDPPDRHCRILHDATEYRHMPVLHGIARQPYLRPDGTLVTRAGYDEATGIFGAFLESRYRIPSCPSREDAKKALAGIDTLLSEFRFQNTLDFAAAVCGILTATIRPTLPLAPMVHVGAPEFGSGKTYLCELFLAFATPQPTAPIAFPCSDDECRKILLAELMSAAPAIFFDNITCDLLAHSSLCAALTSRALSGRILGLSKSSRPSTQALFLYTGVNVSPVQDMIRRTMTIYLDPGGQQPETRAYQCDPVTEVRQNREYWVATVLTIIRAWIVAGHPKTECPPVAGFSDWSDLCRQSLLWLGLPDPAASMFSTTFDPDRVALLQVLVAWHNAFDEKPMLLRDVIAVTSRPGFKDLREALEDVAGERTTQINRRKFGWWLVRHEGRVLNGLRFRRCANSRGAVAWNVQQVSQVSPAPSAEFVTSLPRDTCETT
ncbi:MAG TPA: hypothetical protein VI457_09470 [Methylococcaceae bacterium]|nr:hypothetical protein [Methylococcaceae bacterium]